MDSTFMNSEDSKTFDPNRLFFNLTDKHALYKEKKLYKNKKFKVSAPT